MRNISSRKFICRLVFQANSNSFLHFILGSIALLCVKGRLSFSLSFSQRTQISRPRFRRHRGGTRITKHFQYQKRILHLNSAFVYGKKDRTSLGESSPRTNTFPAIPWRESWANTLSFSLSHREVFFCSFFPPFALVWIGFDGRRRRRSGVHSTHSWRRSSLKLSLSHHSWYELTLLLQTYRIKEKEEMEPPPAHPFPTFWRRGVSVRLNNNICETLRNTSIKKSFFSKISL